MKPSDTNITKKRTSLFIITTLFILLLLSFAAIATTTISDTAITTTGSIELMDNTFSHTENTNASLRFTLQNLNAGTNASAVISALNNVGGSMSIGVGSSNFMIGTENHSNITALFSRSRGETIFANFYNRMFSWSYNPSDDNNASNLVELMRLDGNGLNVSVFNTGNILADEYDMIIGNDAGAIKLGNAELSSGGEMTTGSADFNGTMLFLLPDPVGSVFEFVFGSGSSDIRWAVPKTGVGNAMQMVRSVMVGGNNAGIFNDNIINCTAQGYRFIDCATGVTGADLGIYDDIEFLGSLYGGNGTWNVTDDGNFDTIGNVTGENVFSPQYIFAHTNQTIPLDGANLWTNITFLQEETSIKKGVTHTHNDSTNNTFTINRSGIYDLSFNFDVIDTSVGASDIDIAGRLIYDNGTEIVGSVFETDLTKQAIETELSHEFLAQFNAGDKIIFQFTATDVDVEMSTHGTFGVHPDSATIAIKKIANI